MAITLPHAFYKLDSSSFYPINVNLVAALCYGDDLGTESGPEEALTCPKSKKRPNSRSSNKKTPEDNLALVCRDEEPPNAHGKENGTVEARTDKFSLRK